ncbi:ABC transporter ATP-binding protein [filamentous cyanobacterium LEGE 11480]|uniref:ABC transporter ATP-binding protein n=1 Tax=Romeriopsis navalis LEGE 11480 TaxID=2777977 RepID=A0A928Z4D4_9CYAN|nr:ABC transporter ATP-binding protein [Romeriopsis navalis]MBE9030917.1 ABC transporter ATP-binding protein [Romeriopsis navalis LEGE 11480]
MFLETQHLGKQFERQLALDDVNLQIRQGDVYGLIGPNGAGKTTLLRVLALADEPTLGKVWFDGQPLVYGRHLPAQKQRIGFLPDDYPLYNEMLVWHYLDYMARLYLMQEPQRADRINQVLELVQLESKRDSRIGTLSRGMRQRLSLAQAIIHQPDLLLMDEPVSGLDPLARSQFRQIVKRLQAEGMTIIISSHILSDLEDFCSAVGVMEQGRLVESALLSDLYDRLSVRRLSISVLDELARLQALLAQQGQIQAIEVVDDTTLQATFSGNDGDRLALLKTLMEAGVAITDFHVTQENLESIFLKMDYQRTA